MATLSINHIDEKAFKQIDRTADHAGESPPELARFLLAAGMYHAQQMSFQAASNLSGLGFDGFKKRLRETFSTGYIIPAQVGNKDISFAKRLFDKS